MENEDINKLKSSIYKELLKIVPLYLLYFSLVPFILVRKFGEITYGDNLPYWVSLVAIGIPFLICFFHLLVRADFYRTKFTEAGGNTAKASSIIISLMMLIPLVILQLTIILFKILGRYYK